MKKLLFVVLLPMALGCCESKQPVVKSNAPEIAGAFYIIVNQDIDIFPEIKPRVKEAIKDGAIDYDELEMIYEGVETMEAEGVDKMKWKIREEVGLPPFILRFN